jgi:DNA-binding MarR family transcriptional regulator
MLEGFTPEARELVAVATAQARVLGHDWVGTEHLLFGLLSEPGGQASAALATVGIDRERVGALLEPRLGRGAAAPAPGELPFTSAAQRALARAVGEASAHGESRAGPGHLLLALVADREAGGTRLLRELGATLDTVASAIERLISPSTRGIELGWRARPVALAALGAAVLTRRAFDHRSAGAFTPVEMQVLAHLAIGVSDASPTHQPGEDAASLAVALACDRPDLDEAIESLRRRGLIVSLIQYEHSERVAITPGGEAIIEAWLERIVPLFGRWPPERQDVEDATDD